MKLGSGSTFIGTVIAPEAHIDVHEDARVTGAVYGKKVQIKKNASILGDPALDLFIGLFLP